MRVVTSCVVLFLLGVSWPQLADSAQRQKMAILVDTDIGTALDDPYALALLLASEQCELLGVTTCTSQAEDRAWMVCRFLTAMGIKDVPVAYGHGPQPKSQIDWQIQYRRHPAVVWNRTIKPASEPAEALMHRILNERKGRVTILALGPLTNVARLLEKHPDDQKLIERIVLMGGSLHVGYDGEPPAIAEWNIKSDVAAAQRVFASGIPLVVAPLDATANVELSKAQERKLFAAQTPLTLELQSLLQLYEGNDRVLHDAVAARLALDPSFCRTKSLHLVVEKDGKTRIAKAKANAQVAVQVDAGKFAAWYVRAVTAHGQRLVHNPPKNRAEVISRRGLPRVVHAFEDYDNDIEKRWWMTGKLELKDMPEGSRRACRAVLTQDYDAKMGDRQARYKAVIFNPVPGPPMGPNTRLSFRYKLSGTDTIRVQLFSLSNGYHRYLSLEGVPQDRWATATVDMTKMRRPDGSGGPLAKDERIDDIQFYVDPRADLIIDEMILYEEAPEREKRPFPTRLLFTGWFDTGKQGREWPGDFEIVLHEKPRTWDAARSVTNEQTGKPWIRLHMRGHRRLAGRINLRFDYMLSSRHGATVALVNSDTKQKMTQSFPAQKPGEWAEAMLSFQAGDSIDNMAQADEIHFHLDDAQGELKIDNLLLYVPGD